MPEFLGYDLIDVVGIKDGNGVPIQHTSDNNDGKD